jgi:hypothetical protein
MGNINFRLGVGGGRRRQSIATARKHADLASIGRTAVIITTPSAAEGSGMPFQK